MKTTNIREMLFALIRQGYSETQIAQLTLAHQSTISRILSGQIRDPRGSIALTIRALFEALPVQN